MLQNKLFKTPEAARNCEVGNIVLRQNEFNGIIENTAFDPYLTVYDSSYHNEQEYSNAFQEHLKEAAQIVCDKLRVGKLIEIGCGKGYFLKELKKSGMDVIGFDPSYAGTEDFIVTDFYPGRCVLKADGIILRHVLEHIKNPIEFLNEVAGINDYRGRIYIEVPCMDWILKNRAWFDVFYEHVNYFRLNDFNKIFSSIIESGHFFGGQYFYIIAELSSLISKKDAYDYQSVDFPADFQSGLRHIADDLKKTSDKICIWGAASKGVITSLLLQRMAINIDYAVDINPAKQGYYLPVTGLRVCNPDECINDSNTIILITNSNYFDEIVAMTNSKYKYWAVENYAF